MVTTFLYKGKAVHILQDKRKGKAIYRVKISGREIDFLSKPCAAIRFACNFIDVVTGEDYMGSKKHKVAIGGVAGMN